MTMTKTSLLRTWPGTETEVVREGVRTTTLHKIITVWYGTEMAVCEEVE